VRATRDGVTDAGHVARVLRRADDGRPGRAAPGLACVRCGAGIAVTARASIRLRRVRAQTRRRIARADGVTLVLGRAHDPVRPRTHADLTGVGARAGAPVVARCAVGRGRIGARAGRRIAGAGDMTLVARRAGGGAAADAYAVDAHVDLGARVAVVARARHEVSHGAERRDAVADTVRRADVA